MPRRHAPRGPIIQRDPIEPGNPIDGRPRCTATNRRGERCGRSPILGGSVCWMHGGAAPQVQAKAMERLRTLQYPAIERLAELIDQQEFPTVAYAASRDVLDRTLGKAKEEVTITATVNVVDILQQRHARNRKRDPE